MSLVQEYFDLTKKYQLDYGAKTILLMQVGSFFEVYGHKDKKTQLISGSNIEAFSRICDLNIVEKNVCVSFNSGEKDVEVLMAGFKDIQIEKYIKKIQEASYTAVVFTQDEAAKNTTRSCAGIFSPGTYFSNDSQKLSNNITCIWIEVLENKMFLKGKHVLVGIANIDILTGKSNLYQFKETFTNNPTDFDELEHFISVYKPSELICISNLSEKEIHTILAYINIQCINIHILSLESKESKESKKSNRHFKSKKSYKNKDTLKLIINIPVGNSNVEFIDDYNLLDLTVNQARHIPEFESSYYLNCNNSLKTRINTLAKNDAELSKYTNYTNSEANSYCKCSLNKLGRFKIRDVIDKINRQQLNNLTDCVKDTIQSVKSRLTKNKKNSSINNSLRTTKRH